MAHVWPILAFIVGVTLAAHIKSGRVERVVTYPLRWTMAVQVFVLVVIGFVPVTVAHSYVTVPIAFLAAVQMGLFRNIGDLAYLPVATTGNLMRFVEAGTTASSRRSASRRAAGSTARSSSPSRGRLDRRLRQPRLGRARDLAGRGLSCRHAGPVHRRRAGAAVNYDPRMIRRPVLRVRRSRVALRAGRASPSTGSRPTPAHCCDSVSPPPLVVQLSGTRCGDGHGGSGRLRGGRQVRRCQCRVRADAG